MLGAIRLPSGETLIVEVETGTGATAEQLAELAYKGAPDLPDDARLTGAFSGKAAELLQEQLEGLARTVVDTLKKLKPREIAIEANIKFTGDVKIIPFIASASSEGGLKVIVKWVNPE